MKHRIAMLTLGLFGVVATFYALQLIGCIASAAVTP